MALPSRFGIPRASRPGRLPERIGYAVLVVALLTAPILYGVAVESLSRHMTFVMTYGWEDPSFPSLWDLTPWTRQNGTMEKFQDILSLSPFPGGTQGTEVSAERMGLPTVDFGRYPYLSMRIRTSGVDIAARLALWPNPDGFVIVLLKTYADPGWHSEIIDLRSFGIAKPVQLHAIEVGLYVVGASASAPAWVSYSDLAFVNLTPVEP